MQLARAAVGQNVAITQSPSDEKLIVGVKWIVGDGPGSSRNGAMEHVTVSST